MAASNSDSGYLKRLKRLSTQLTNQLEQGGRAPSRKQVHKLRVTNRRLRTALELSEKGKSGDLSGGLKQDLQKLGRVLGEVRELNIALRDARSFDLKTKGIRKLRRKACKKVARTLTGKRRDRITRKLKKAIERIEQRAKLDPSVSLPGLKKDLAPWLKRSACSSPKEMHAFRIALKKARYALETVGRPVEPIRRLQNHLGRTHDMEVLCKLVGKSAPAKKLAERETRKARALAKPTLLFALKQLTR